MKTVRIFSDRIRDRIRLEGFRCVCIRVRIFNIQYRIRIRILKSYICDVDIQSYFIRHGWYYPYSNLTKNMKTNMISVISVCIRFVLIPNQLAVSQHCRFMVPIGIVDESNNTTGSSPKPYSCDHCWFRATTGSWFGKHYRLSTVVCLSSVQFLGDLVVTLLWILLFNSLFYFCVILYISYGYDNVD